MELFRKKKWILTGVASVLLVLGLGAAGVVMAQSPDLGLDYATSIGLGTRDVRDTAGTVIRAFLGLIGILLVGLMLYAGFLWMTAGGKEDQVRKAKRMIVNAVIGLIIMMSAYAIVSFIFDAAAPGNVVGGDGNCPSGNCPTTCLGCGSGSAFMVDGIAPAGPGPGDLGWPRNAHIKVMFNAAVSPTSIDADTVKVARCNPRNEPFDLSSCTVEVPGELTVSGGLVEFVPDPPSGETESLFESDRWYRILLIASGGAGGITDTKGRALTCFPVLEDISTTSPNIKRYCERAMAFSDKLDMTPPAVSLYAPKTPPRYCAGALAPVAVSARGNDDFLVSDVAFSLNEDADNAQLVDAQGVSFPSPVQVINSSSSNPFFVIDSVFVDMAGLQDKADHTLTAVGSDLVGRQSPEVSAVFHLDPAHCCNKVTDGDETGVDCGGVDCGACFGDSCETDADCASGFCNPTTKKCDNRPIIEGLSPAAAGPGSSITISGRGFGVAVGGVTFLGGPGDQDDVSVQACAPAAWDGVHDPNTVVVSVPPNAQSGPIRLNSAYGAFDTTDDNFGIVVDFTVNSIVTPGVCYLEPNSGLPGGTFKIHGSGFGSPANDSKAYIGGFELTVGAGGWGQTEITAAVPPQVAEGSYPVSVMAGGKSSNKVPYLVTRDSAAGGPRIVSVEPTSGPPGTYMTIYGSGFGTGQGNVYFRRAGSGEEGYGQDTACGIVWHDDYIVVKVPEETSANQILLPGKYAIVVDTAAPVETSNSDVLFEMTSGAPGPGICSITPDNGLPGTPLEIKGDNLGGTSSHPALVPRFSVHFTDQNQLGHCLRDPSISCSTDGVCGGTGECVKSQYYCVRNGSASCTKWGEDCVSGGQCVKDGAVQLNYGTWNSTSIIQVPVPGQIGNADTWPQSGPVHVVAADKVSVNSIPFKVQNCNEAGSASCEAGTVCCQNGSCQVSCVPIAKSSAYGWRMSTEVLPSEMRVIERASCSAEPGNSWMMSPNPYKDSTDACVNSPIYFEFNYRAISSSFDTSNILVRECIGDPENLDCSIPVPKGGGWTEMCETVDGISACFGYQWFPTDGHAAPADQPFLKKNTWYEVTLRSDPVGQIGFHTPNGRYLDGDMNREAGGDYVYRFRTRDSDEPCSVSKMMVIPNKGLISVPEQKYYFSAIPFAANCNIIQCLDNFPYTLSWAESLIDKLDLSIAAPTGQACRKPVIGKDETLPGQPTKLVGNIYDSKKNKTVSNFSEVDVQYRKPRVVKVGPTDGCLNACANSRVFAEFNVDMDENTLVQSGNFTMYRCRNSSCLPPYDYANTVPPSCSPVAEQKSVNNVNEYRTVSMECGNVNLTPSTFYIVSVRGGEDGVKSRTGGLLTGLNDGEFYRWFFRVKDLPKAECDVDHAIMEPKEATLNYVGERVGLKVIPVGAPDECNPDGQWLNGWAEDWDWDLGINPALGGFVNGDESDTPHMNPPVDTDPSYVSGCTNFCSLSGSRPKHVQCGDGEKDPQYEACEIGDTNCSENCLLMGTTAPTCGNHQIDPGENCEVWQNPNNEWVFPPGCKEPTSTERGCTLLGALAGGGVCGDSYPSEGEECDDGNVTSGDGCSRDCLLEGSLRSCNDVAGGEPCTIACRNGKVEDGEDPICETNINLCSASTCLRKYAKECVDGEGYNCGSSAFYTKASFCGDGILGQGEVASCEKSFGDALNDPWQVVQAEPQDGVFNTAAPDGQTTVVTTDLPEIPAGNEGVSEITLDCSCREQGTTLEAQDGYCAQFITGGTELGCASDSCCRTRPRVVHVNPLHNSENVCRNRSVLLSFSEQMDAGSMASSIVVGYDSGSEDPDACGAGQSMTKSWWRRAIAFVWDGIAGLWHSVFGQDAKAANDNVYCTIKGTVSVLNDAVSKTSVVIFRPTKAYPSNTGIRVKVMPTAKSIYGVAYGGIGYTLDFKTSPDICTLDLVDTVPNKMLISDDGDQGVMVRARGLHLEGGVAQEIVPVEEYSWLWNWGPPLAQTEPIVRLRQFFDEMQTDAVTGEQKIRRTIQLPDAKVRARNPDLGDAPSDYVPKDGTAYLTVAAEEDLLAAGTIKQSRIGVAQVQVMLCDNPWPKKRVCDIDPTETSYTMPWGEEVNCNPGGIVWAPFRDVSTNMSFYYCRDRESSGGGAGSLLPVLKEDLTVVEPGRDILKDYLLTYLGSHSSAKWAKDALGVRIIKNFEHLPVAQWYVNRGFEGTPRPITVAGYDAVQSGRTVYVGAAALSPTADPNIFDGYTNVGAVTYSDNAADETQLIYGQILQNINFNANLTNEQVCMRPSTVQGVIYPTPVSCKVDQDCWVDDQGAVVAGWRAKYRCDKEVGRCATGCNENADCSSLGAGATCNTSTKMCVSGSATIYDKNVGTRITCSDDLSCKTDSTGTYRTGLGNYWCNADWNKVTRDAKRVHDLIGARKSMLDRLKRDGSVPTLQAGTFIPSMSVSAWPSWGSVVQLASDPVNKHGDCISNLNGYDPKTCWNSTDLQYWCPVGSQVYRYRSIGLNDFEIAASLELNKPVAYGQALGINWHGNTCVELPVATCAQNPECRIETNGTSTVLDDRCQFKQGELLIKGMTVSSIGCEGNSIGGSGVCGDGIINMSGGSAEVCELGQRQTVGCCRQDNGNYKLGSCTSAELNSGDYRQGQINQSCAASCGSWVNEGSCLAGVCGDGVVQSPEVCDDGELNGLYGRCNIDCTGAGARCGDGKRQANEACDCREANGQYIFDGVLPSFSTVDATHKCKADYVSGGDPSCSWDCQAAGPRCGDGIINGNEICDGGVQQFRGYCNNPEETGCNTDGDCPDGVSCGHFCPQEEQYNIRSCNLNNPADPEDNQYGEACHWGAWECSAEGFCGDGVKQSSEQCDDGNTDNTDGCVIDKVRGDNYSCKLPRCGDYHVQASLAEECDAGAKNGIACIPEYGFTCSYCTSACKVMTVSGGFCGDKVVQGRTEPPWGPEDCDFNQSAKGNYYCVSTAPEHQACGYPANTSNLNGFTCQDSSLDLTGTVKSICTEKCSTICEFGYRTCYNDPDSVDTDGDGLNNERCDSDDDNDRVPDHADCAPLDPNIHPAHTYKDSNGNPITVQAATEVCDGVDNDCDGGVDEIINIAGKVTDPQTGGGLQNAKVQISCGMTPIVEQNLDSNGRYSISGEYNELISCTGTLTVKIVSTNGKKLCGGEQALSVDANSCITLADADFTDVTYQPPTGSARFSVRWDQPDRDIDLHMVFAPSAAGGISEVYYGQLIVNDNGKTAELEVDDLGYGGNYDPGGIETITVAYSPNKKYWFYLHDFDDKGKMNDPDLGLKGQWWFDDCSGGSFDFSSSSQADNTGLSSTARYIGMGGFPSAGGGKLQTYPGGAAGKFSFCSAAVSGGAAQCVE